ncbi:MAG: TonB-dependent receptor [bacterium]
MMSTLEKVACGVLCVGVLVSPLSAPSAQDKKIPKPKPIAPSKSADKDSLDQQTRLEIPEVLILGEDISVRLPGSKRVERVSDSILPIEQRANRRLESQPVSAATDKFPGRQTASLDHSSQVEARYGSYNTLSLFGKHWRQLERLSLDLEGSFDKSDGQFNNSQFENWRIGFAGSYDLNQRHRLNAGARFSSYDYGLWGSPFEHKRDWSQLEIFAGLSGWLNPMSRYEFRFSQSNSPREGQIDSVAGVDTIPSFREKNRDIALKFMQTRGAWEFSLGGNILLNRYETAPETNPLLFPLNRNTNSLSDIFLGIGKQLGQNGSVNLGVRYQFYDLDELNQDDGRFQPSFEFNWSASPYVRFAGFYKSLFRLTTRQQLLAINPAANLAIPHSPIEDVNVSVGLGLEWRPNSLSSFNLSYNYQKIDNLQIWQIGEVVGSGVDAPENYLFRVGAMPRAHLSFLTLVFTAGNLKPYRFRSTLILSGSAIDEFGNSISPEPLEQDIPYLEDVRLPLEFEYLLLPNLTATISGQYLSTRVFELSQPQLGKSYVRLNAKLSYKKNLFVFYLLGTNLLDQKYEIWQRYRETGIQVFAGSKVSF